MVYKICFFLSTVVFVSVQSSEVSKSAVVKQKGSKEYVSSDEIRKFVNNTNHPPIDDEQGSIQVAIILDDNHNDVTETLVKLSNSENKPSALNEKVTSNVDKGRFENITNKNSNEPYRIILNTDIADKDNDLNVHKQKFVNTNTNSNGKLKQDNSNRSSKSRNILKIPVEVVYDDVQSKPKLGQNLNEEEKKQRRKEPNNRIRGIKNNKIKDEPEAIKNVTTKTEKEANNNGTAISESNNSGPEKRKQEFKRRNGIKPPVVPIVESENFLSLGGSFRYKYEGGDGTKAFEQGELKTLSDERTGEAVVGGYSYKDKDGTQFELTYTADENGYRPVGAHLPTPPPVPPAIARALAHLATKTTPEPVTEPDRSDDATRHSDVSSETRSSV